MKLKNHFVFVLGIVLIIAYWLSIRPTNSIVGYVEDICQGGDFLRQLMAHNLDAFGKPVFKSDQIMAPFGNSIPFMPWSLESTWMGAYFWKWNRDFPFLWFYLGVSLMAIYVFVGRMLILAALPSNAAFGIASIVVLVNSARHIKTWYHFEHLLHHWIYFSIFLDVLIWQRFIKRRTIEVHLEIWRGVCLLGMFGTAGYYWGPLILEWFLVRLCIFWVAKGRDSLIASKRPDAERLKFIDFVMDKRSCVLPLVVGLVFFILDLKWFLPWLEEVRKFGRVPQSVFAGLHFGYLFRPLWLDTLIKPFFPSLPGIELPETSGTLGWIYLFPLGLSLFLMRGRKPILQPSDGHDLLQESNSGMHSAPNPSDRSLPFIILLGIGLLYACLPAQFFQNALQAVVPFMEFFRVKSRWGIFFPPLAGAIIALSYPALRQSFLQNARRNYKWFILFGISSVLELHFFLTPVSLQGGPSSELLGMMNRVRNLPGDTVLDLPFCVTGGNGICTAEQCPSHPRSTLGSCLRQWHDKKVFGLYASRLSEKDCQIYQHPPYLSWFKAWGESRCLNELEWDQFCRYLDQRSEISAVFLYPELWPGFVEKECRGEFEKRLGKHLGEAEAPTEYNRGMKWEKITRIQWYSPHCIDTIPK